MSYRNPTQVVDTQTGQHYANLQKTIAGSFGNYAKSYEAANARRRAEEKENQKISLASRNKILSEQNIQLKDFGNIETKYPTISFINAGSGIRKLADIKMQDTQTPEQNIEARALGKMGTTYRVATTNLLSNKEIYVDAYNKQPGSYEGFDINAPASEIENNNNLFKLGSDSLTYETQARHELNGSGELEIRFDVIKAGKKTVTHSGATAFDYIVPNFQPYVDKTIKENIGGFNYKDGNDPIYIGGKEYKNADGKVIGVYPNKDVYKKSIRQSVSANLLGGQSRLQATMLNNNIFNRNPDESIANGKNWIEFVDGDTSQEKKDQDLIKQSIVDNGVDFITNQAAALQAPYIYKQGEKIPKGSSLEAGKGEGKAFYNELKQDPVGIYEEYTDRAPGFNRDKNTITIYGKDTEDGKNIVYDMNKRTQRNKFYLDLLKITERGEGSSLNKQAFRKDFENAMRLSTKKRLDPLNPNK